MPIFECQSEKTCSECDFLPWLLELPWQHKKDVKEWTANIRQYVVKNFINQNQDSRDKNLLSSLMKKVDSDELNNVGYHFLGSM